MTVKIDSATLARDIITRISEPASRLHLEDESPNLSDIGYDSLSVVELVMAVEQELDDRGITTDLDDDIWSVSSLVSDVERDISTLLEGRDIN